jgi:hypothetical protein
MENVTIENVRDALAKRGIQLKPINRDRQAIKDEPKWELIKN